MPSFPLLICEVGKMVAPEVVFRRLLRDWMGQGLAWAGRCSGAQEGACRMQAAVFATGTYEALVCRPGV